jgi:hypothetical protein
MIQRFKGVSVQACFADRGCEMRGLFLFHHAHEFFDILDGVERLRQFIDPFAGFENSFHNSILRRIAPEHDLPAAHRQACQRPG